MCMHLCPPEESRHSSRCEWRPLVAKQPCDCARGCSRHLHLPSALATAEGNQDASRPTSAIGTTSHRQQLVGPDDCCTSGGIDDSKHGDMLTRRSASKCCQARCLYARRLSPLEAQLTRGPALRTLLARNSSQSHSARLI